MIEADAKQLLGRLWSRLMRAADAMRLLGRLWLRLIRAADAVVVVMAGAAGATASEC